MRTRQHQVRREIQELVPELVELRRDFHRHPELGFSEIRTSGIVAKYLRDLGLMVEDGIANTGVVALLQGTAPSSSGRTLLLRYDMDALPVQEENQTPYASQVRGVMHACGHDGHTAIGLVTAKVLQRMKDCIPGNIKFVFQPAEEGPGGAAPMIKQGVLESPVVDAAVGMHLWNTQPTGTVGVRQGPTMAAVDQLQITIQGRGGHGASPHQTIDPIVTAAHVVTALQTVVSRTVNPLESGVVTIGSIHGGHASNVIPERVEMSGTVRTFTQEVRQAIKRKVVELLDGITKAFGARYTLSYEEGYPACVNDPKMAEMVAACVNSEVDESIPVLATQTMGGEDMAYFLQRVPGCYFFVGSSNGEKGLNHPHHSPRFDFDEAALPLGVELFTRVVERYFGIQAPR